MDEDADYDSDDERREPAIAMVIEMLPRLLDPNDPIPRNNSEFTATMRLDELMKNNLHPGFFRSETRMNKPTFVALCAV